MSQQPINRNKILRVMSFIIASKKKKPHKGIKTAKYVKGFHTGKPQNEIERGYRNIK